MSDRRIAESIAAAGSARERRRAVRTLDQARAVAVARELRLICYETWSSEPARARRTSAALDSLAKEFPSAEIAANAAWVAGIAAITRGRFESAVRNLDLAADRFKAIGSRADAANTQVAKLIALALTGRLDDALRVGRLALRSMKALGDKLAAGKIEMNLSNIVTRLGRHREAEKLCLSALAHFRESGAAEWETMALNDLANTYSELDDFRRADEFYALALAKARDGGMLVTEAEIEASSGNLARARGRFDDALRLLESSRSKYESLRMPHESAISELEIATIYADLNLTNEAATIFARAAKRLKRLGLPAEEARALAGAGNAALRLGDLRRAASAFRRAAELFVETGDPGGAASVIIADTELRLEHDEPGAALRILDGASRHLARGGNARSKLSAGWLRAECLRRLGRTAAARRKLKATLEGSIAAEQPNLETACLNSLGEIDLRAGRFGAAEESFKRAVKIVERLRAPLPGEEFRMSFLSEKLAPFENLVRVALARGEIDAALAALEAARARTISEGASPTDADPALAAERDSLREELNWYYSRLRSADEQAQIEKEIRRREHKIADLERRISALGTGAAGSHRREFDLDRFRAGLGDRALIEFVRLDGSFGAFVATDERVAFFPALATQGEIAALLEGLQFQFGTLRYGGAGIGTFAASLRSRADRYLDSLGAKLFAPLADAVAGRGLIIVPAGILNYVPFHALRAPRYLIEDHEIAYAPSAAVAAGLDDRERAAPHSPLLVGFADEAIPLVGDEIAHLGKLFPSARTLVAGDATFAGFREQAPSADAIHIACHGRFRPDNPMYSSLHLADGFVTARDVCAIRLAARVVTLSACETGLSKIFPGDEIVGLARGFLAAGAGALVLSLWTVNDEATARLMVAFYSNLQHGDSVPASLRKAQLEFVDAGAHPYLWSPFISIGR